MSRWIADIAQPQSHRATATIITVIVLLIVVDGGCVTRSKPVVQVAPATRPVLNEPPIIDISRGGAGLPLEDGTDIRSRDALLHGLLKGYEARLQLPAEAAPITLVGTDDRKLDLLRIDVSGAQVRENYRPKQYGVPGEPEPAFSVRKFEYVADPLLYQHGQTRLRLSANDARFGLLRDRSGAPTLVLTDAHDGAFEFSVPLSGFKPMLRGGAGTNSAGMFVVHDVNLKFTSDDPHSLSVQMQVNASLFLIPTTFRMHARADIDSYCNVRLSELSCDGMDPGGKVLALVVDGAMQKYNGKLQPLVRWPGNRIVLTDVQIKVDDSLSVVTTFAGLPAEKPVVGHK